MRSEKEMFEMILDIAKKDDNIKAVYMNGSRANSNVPKDIFQDYDIVYVVTDTKFYYENESWIDQFGKRLYMQMPEKMDFLRGAAYDFDACYGWLMQFADGNRLDLHVESVAHAMAHIEEDLLCVILLDKEQILPQMRPSTDEAFHVKKPSENDFICDCNNFWWCLNNVAKGLWREEIPYVMDMTNYYIRPHLVNVLSWSIGLATDFSCSVGKSGKYMKKYLTEDVWNRFLRTYPAGEVGIIWEGIFVMCDLFDEVATQVAQKMNYTYNHEEAAASRAFLEHVQQLPKNAIEIFSGK